jgi:hypothetical protein
MNCYFARLIQARRKIILIKHVLKEVDFNEKVCHLLFYQIKTIEFCTEIQKPGSYPKVEAGARWLRWHHRPQQLEESEKKSLSGTQSS